MMVKVYSQSKYRGFDFTQFSYSDLWTHRQLSFDGEEFFTFQIQIKRPDLGLLKCFLGLEIARSDIGSMVCQCQYTLQLLEDFDFLTSKPKSTPMHPRITLQNSDEELIDVTWSHWTTHYILTSQRLVNPIRP